MTAPAGEPPRVMGQYKVRSRLNNEATNNLFLTCLFNQLDNLASIVWTRFWVDRFADVTLLPRTGWTWTVDSPFSDNVDVSKKSRTKTIVST